MKVGILTYHYVPNFGAQLQALSTIGFVKRIGHTPILLHWQPTDLDDIYINRVPEIQRLEHSEFAKQNFPLTNICKNEDDLIREIECHNLDMIITGSDALFKYIPKACRLRFSKRKFRFVKIKVPCVEKIPGNPFFCDYYDSLNRKIPIVAFSVSSQNAPFYKMNANERALIGKCLNNFKSITVRDDWTKKMVETLSFHKNIQITPDPVFSFNQNCYVNIPTKEEILKKYNLPQNYVLISFWTKNVNSSYIGKISEELQKNGFGPVAFPMPEGLIDFGIDLKIDLPLSPLEWYAIIKYSNGYIGERMHPIVVCLHNAVPFFAYDEYGIEQKSVLGLIRKYMQDSSKTFHIVSKAGFENNLFAYKTKCSLPKSDDIVEALLNFDRQKCMDFAKEQQLAYENQMMKFLKDCEI